MDSILSIRAYLPINLEHVIPSPNKVYSLGASTIMAAAIGGGYGVVARLIYPHTGIIPLHYAIWFAVAFQINKGIHLTEHLFRYFMGGSSSLAALEKISEVKWDEHDRIRYHFWKIMLLRDQCLKVIDQETSQFFAIRPYQDVQKDNLHTATFLEMCRYRTWRVFKSTLIKAMSSAIAYQLTHQIGLALPSRTTASFLIVMQSIVREIILVPAMHVYVRFCQEVIGEIDAKTAAYSSYWISRILPEL